MRSPVVRVPHRAFLRREGLVRTLIMDPKFFGPRFAAALAGLEEQSSVASRPCR